MGFMDAINAEDRVTLTVTTCIALIRDAERSRVQTEFLANAVLHDVPREHICATFNLKKEDA